MEHMFSNFQYIKIITSQWAVPTKTYKHIIFIILRALSINLTKRMKVHQPIQSSKPSTFPRVTTGARYLFAERNRAQKNDSLGSRVYRTSVGGRYLIAHVVRLSNDALLSVSVRGSFGSQNPGRASVHTRANTHSRVVPFESPALQADPFALERSASVTDKSR